MALETSMHVSGTSPRAKLSVEASLQIVFFMVGQGELPTEFLGRLP